MQAELPRRGSAGVAVAPADNGVVVRAVLPGLAAQKAGLAADDVLTKIDGEAIGSTADFTTRIARKRPGDRIRIDFLRGGAPRSAELTIEPYPRETSDAYDVIYGETSADGNRFRTIITKPKGNGPFPTLFMVQGLGCGTIDNPPPGGTWPRLIDDITKAGIATLRVDKPGVGDSEGGPCSAVDFHAEVRAYRAALASLKGRPFVDEKKVFLFGHSMGGIQAPLIATALPLRGIIVYGTTFNSWAHYIVDNTRRQMRLRGESFTDISDEERRLEKFNSLFYVQKQPLEKILADNPEYREGFPDGKTYTAGKEGKYFQQIYDTSLAKAWKETDSTVLAVYGGSDFLTRAEEAESLAAAVNSYRPGTARFVQLDGIDHWLQKTADQKASLNTGYGKGEYDDRLGREIIAFISSSPDRSSPGTAPRRSSS